MSKFSLVAAAALVLVSAQAMAAGTAPQNFDVTVTLTSKCQVKGTPAPVVAFGAYTAFGAAPAPATASIVFECTRGLAAPTAAFDVVNGTSSASGAAPTGEGVVAGLKYTLSAAGSQTLAGAAPVAGGAAGSAQEFTWVVTGNMAGGQAGTDTAGAATQQRTLTISY